MIDTLMALWNRGYSGRLMVVALTFGCMCISISLLFITVGSAWGSLFPHGRAPVVTGNATNTADAAFTTATIPPPYITPTTATPVTAPNPCVSTSVVVLAPSPRVSASANSGQSNIPVHQTTATPKPTPTHARPVRTPTPVATAMPSPTSIPSPVPTPSPSPTSTVVAATPTAGVTPTATATPGTTPTDTPTVGVTPTDTSTPGTTPTVGVTATVTSTPGIPATATATATIAPTLTPVVGQTPVTSPTSGTGHTSARGGGALLPGTPSGIVVNNNQSGGNGLGVNCLIDSLPTSAAMLAILQHAAWLIVGGSLLGTLLFYGRMRQISRKV